MSEERLNLIKENVYARCSIANISGIGMTAPDKEEVELIKEIERLNNIINKLETGIENMWVDNTGEDTWEYEEEACLYREEFLDKIKELKGVDKE